MNNYFLVMVVFFCFALEDEVLSALSFGMMLTAVSSSSSGTWLGQGLHPI